MATYEEIYGKRVKEFDSDPTLDSTYEGQVWYDKSSGTLKSVVNFFAFRSGANLPTARDFGTGGGATQDAAWVAGGETGPSVINSTVEYNGFVWTTSGNMGTARVRMALGNCGTETTGIGSGGFIAPPSPIQSIVEEYDGSTWTGGTSLPASRQFHGGTGPQTDHLILGGGPVSATSALGYNGSAWSSEGSSSEDFAYYGLAGANSGAALAFYGADGTPGTNRTTGEEYNGTSWTTVIGTLPNQGNSGQAQGTTTAAIFAGNSTTVRSYDGTSITLEPAMTQPRGNGYIGGTGTSGITSGGSAPGSTANTEEFDRSINTITNAAWSSGGNLNTARRDGASAGNATAHSNALYFSGNEPANSAKSEAYDGTSWSEGPDLSTGRGGARGFGVNTAAVCCAGSAPPSQNVTEEYDGSSWTSGGNLNTGRTSHNSFGTLTAGVASGGNEQGPAGYTTATELYDGTSWTTSPATLPTAMHQGGIDGAGLQTAGLVAGGDGPGSPTTAAYEFDGEAWTAGGSLITGAEGAGMNGTQTSAFFTGGNNGGAITTTQNYDGTSWSTRPSISTARYYTNGSGVTVPATLLIGGYSGTANLATTEEFTGQTETATASTLTTS